MASKKAKRFIQLGLPPKLRGRRGDALKQSRYHGWQTAVSTASDRHRWSSRNNIGIRYGRQQDSRRLVVFDFHEEAERIFPDWLWQVAPQVPQPLVIVGSGRGYHVYFSTDEANADCPLAGRYGEARPSGNGRKRLFKFIEPLGERRPVVTAGSRHPAGKRDCFRSQATYANIPHLSAELYQRLIALSRRFDQRPKRSKRAATQSLWLTGSRQGVADCLAYARRFLHGAKRVERNGDIRFLGYGGLLFTANGRGWYTFSEGTGGGLAELIAWHQAIAGEGLC